MGSRETFSTIREQGGLAHAGYNGWLALEDSIQLEIRIYLRVATLKGRHFSPDNENRDVLFAAVALRQVLQVFRSHDGVPDLVHLQRASRFLTVLHAKIEVDSFVMEAKLQAKTMRREKHIVLNPSLCLVICCCECSARQNT